MVKVVHLLCVIRVGALRGPARLDGAVLACFASLGLGSQLGWYELSIKHSQTLLSG